MPRVVVSALVPASVRKRVAVLCVLASLVAAPAATAATTTTDLLPGVTYTREERTVGGRPVVLHVVTAPKPGGLYRLAPVLSNGEVVGRETVTQMQGRLSRRATVVGVNGDLFSYADGSSSGILLQDGALVGRPTASRSSLGIGADGVLYVGRVGFFGRWAIGETPRRTLAQFNRPLSGNGVSLFTPAWGSKTPVAKKAVDVVISEFPKPAPNVDLPGVVAEVREGGGTAIPKGGAVLQAIGPVRQEILTNAVPGAPFVAKLDLRPWWEGVSDAIGGGPALVRDGQLAVPNDEAFSAGQLQPRAPRTAVGQLADGRVVLVAVDGRVPWSAGLDTLDLARELQRLGVVNGIALDSGGSTTLAFDGDVLNTPSSGSERAVSNALMLFYYGVYAAPPSEPVVSPNGDGVAEKELVSYKVVRPSTVRARLLGPNGKPVWREQVEREPGTYPFEVAREALKEGTWRWVVSAVDSDGVESKIERTFVVNNTLGFLRLSKRAITVTRKRGASLGVTFKLTRRARITVTVTDEYGRLVRTIADKTRKRGPVQLSWNARAQGGQVVLAGTYEIHVAARNKLGTVELEQAVTVRRRGRS